LEVVGCVDNRRRARELWEASNGTLPLKEIAAQLGVAEGTLRSWKKRDAWGSSRCNVAESATQRETQRKRRAQVNRRAAETVEANDELTDREKDFCAAFVHAPSAAQAAMKTGRYSTYGAARTAAWEMMKKPAVIAEIKRLKSLKRAAMLADGDDVIELLQRIVYADMSQFADFKGQNVKLKDSKNIDGTIVTEVKRGKGGVSVKLADKLKAVELYYKITGELPLDKHKIAFDNARLKLEQGKIGADNEEALTVLDDILKAIGRQANAD
jgi:phage terminase small subunit